MSRQLKILIVEDSDDDFEATMRAIRKVGNLKGDFFRCENGQEALDFLFHQGQYQNAVTAPRPDLILLDLNMPGKDGKAVLAEIKSTDHLKSIPVVILTTSDSNTDIEKCYQYGANTYIKKPVDMNGFVEAIRYFSDYWSEIAILPEDSR